MSKSKRRQEAIAKRRQSQIKLYAVVIALLLVFVVGVTAFYATSQTEHGQPVADARQAALLSADAPTLGDPGAQVHIVEFLDPACGTCALFFPMVKQWMTEAPDKLRLSVRHVAFHSGADYAVRILEASREQDKYWETLEALLASQRMWVMNHTVQPDKVLPAIAGVGLDMEQLAADMNAVEVLQRIEKDKQDSITLKVSATPEYFVNGRPLPSFGQQQLLDLVREELQKAY
jgi:protein-disulfide isomerase